MGIDDFQGVGEVGFEVEDQFGTTQVEEILFCFGFECDSDLFGILFQDGSLTWIAEIAGFGCGFLLSFLLVPGGISRVMRQIRQR